MLSAWAWSKSISVWNKLSILLSFVDTSLLARELTNRPSARVESISWSELKSIRVNKTRGTSLHFSNFK